MNIKHSFTVAVILSLLIGRSPGADLFWDPNQNNTGKGTSNWTAPLRWDTGSIGGTQATWTDGNNANFAASGIIGTADLTAGGPVSVTNLNVTTASSSVTITTSSSADSLTVTGGASLGGNLTLATSSGTTENVTYNFTGSGISGAGTLTLSKQGDAGTNLLVGLSGASTSVAPAGGVVNVGSTASGLVGFVSSSSGAALNRGIANSTSATTLLAAGAGNTLLVSGAGSGASGSSTVQIGSASLGQTGAVVLSSGASISSARIDINGGSLVLNVVGASDVIGNSTAISMSGSGAGAGISKLSFNPAGGASETVGTLTLAANSVIDFGSGSGNSLYFTGVSDISTWALGANLQIWNYTPGVDHLYFGTSDTGSGLAGVSLANTFLGLNTPVTGRISFFSDNGLTLVQNLPAAGFLPGGAGEIVPVPEPTAVLTGWLLIGAIALRERRIFACVRRVRPRICPA